MNKHSNKMLEKITKLIWEYHPIFRGILDSVQYRYYILMLIFSKHVADEYTSIHEGSHNDQQRRQHNFLLTVKTTCNYLDDMLNPLNHSRKEGIFELRNQLKLDLAEASRDDFDFARYCYDDCKYVDPYGRFKDKGNEFSDLLLFLSDLDLSSASLGGSEVIGKLYEALLSEFASNAGKNEDDFYTPKEISHLLSQLLQVQSDESVYDPTCGTGSLIIQVATGSHVKNVQLYGQEKSFYTLELCMLNMYLHHKEEAKILYGDSIRSPQHLKKGKKLQQFDIVVAHPPFTLLYWGFETTIQDPYHRFKYGSPSKDKPDYAFLQHMIASMKPTGRMAILLPHGVLFRGASEGKIRKNIIENNLIDAVIGLPSNIFYGRSLSVCILVLKNNRNTDDILFIDASQEVSKAKNRNYLTWDNLSKIATAYQARENQKRFSHLATKEEVIAHDYNLNIARYVDTFPEESLDLPAVIDHIKTIEEDLSTIHHELLKACKDLNIDPPFPI